MELAGPPAVLINLATIAFGLCVGSFLNVAIYRLPREGLSLAKPSRSFCPACKARIAWHDNIPVLSWVFLGARCRACQAKISARYPLVALLCGCLSFVIFQAEGPSIRYLGNFYFTCCLLAIAFIDLELMVIPNILVWPTQLLALVIAVASPYPPLAGHFLWGYLAAAGLPEPVISLAGSLIAGIIGFLSLFLLSWLYKILKGRKGMGEGDPPLLSMIAMFLGLPSIIPTLLLSSVLGLAAVAVLVSTGRLHGDKLSSRPIPFGPFLAMAALIYLFLGQSFMSWYFSLMAF